MKRCYVLLLNWNGWQDTIECLESLLRLDYPDYRIIVCDNGSTDGSLERIKAWADGVDQDRPRSKNSPLPSIPPSVSRPLLCARFNRKQIDTGTSQTQDRFLTLIDNEANLGFAGGNNVGLKYLAACDNWDAVWLLNNDTVVMPDSLGKLVERMNIEPVPGICGSTLLYYDRPEKIQALAGGYYCKWIGLPWLHGRSSKFNPATAVARAASVEARMNYVMGASMLISRALFERIGYMDEDYFLFFEETDWAWRANPEFSLAYAPGSIVYHKGGHSIGTSSNPRKKSLVCDYFALRNRLLFSRRHCPEVLPAIYLSLVFALLVRVCCGRLKNAAIIRDIIFGRDRHWQDRLLNSVSGCRIGGDSV
jgi:GT2 family glycosyltransferase